MNIESPPEHPEPEKSGSRFWRGLLHWLGVTATATRQGEDDGVSKGSKAGKQKGLTLAGVTAALNAAKAEDEARPKRFPPALKLGPQSATDPKFWRPDTGGTPLAQDENYQDALKIVAQLDHPNR